MYGCDSVNLNLTIINPTVQTYNHIICSGDSIEINNNFYSQAGIYYDTVQIADCTI